MPGKGAAGSSLSLGEVVHGPVHWDVNSQGSLQLITWKTIHDAEERGLGKTPGHIHSDHVHRQAGRGHEESIMCGASQIIFLTETVGT